MQACEAFLSCIASRDFVWIKLAQYIDQINWRNVMSVNGVVWSVTSGAEGFARAVSTLHLRCDAIIAARAHADAIPECHTYTCSCGASYTRPVKRVCVDTNPPGGAGS